VFYTYDDSKEQAARRLYYSVKQHLIDYDEDHKEYEMDDGVEMDTNQIYDEMVETNYAPEGGYEATVTSLGSGNGSGGSGGSSSSGSVIGIVLVILLLVVVTVGLILFWPGGLAFLQQFLP
jgi:hypothetical protein